MPFVVPIDQAKAEYPEYTFVAALTPSEQKAAFHVKDGAGTDLCLKIIAPNYDVDRIKREIHALQTLSHPNVVGLIEYTFSTKGGVQRHFLVEQFVDGQDLADQLTGQPWDTARAASFFSQLCSGLDALRQTKIVHRDLKPNNIRVRPDGAPVVIDFGLARHLDLPALTKTSDGAAIGTPAYFAPEQFTGTKHDIDHRTDLFAIGVIMYEALVGKHPFSRPGITWPELEDAVCRRDDHFAEQAFVSLPKPWQLLCKRILAKERANRPQDAAQVQAVLGKIGGA